MMIPDIYEVLAYQPLTDKETVLLYTGPTSGKALENAAKYCEERGWFIRQFKHLSAKEAEKIYEPKIIIGAEGL